MKNPSCPASICMPEMHTTGDVTWRCSESEVFSGRTLKGDRHLLVMQETTIIDLLYEAQIVDTSHNTVEYLLEWITATQTQYNPAPCANHPGYLLCTLLGIPSNFSNSV